MDKKVVMIGYGRPLKHFPFERKFDGKNSLSKEESDTFENMLNKEKEKLK